MRISEAADEDIAAICRLVNSAYRGDASRAGWTTEADLLDGIRIDEATLRYYIGTPDSAILKYTEDNQQITGCMYLKKEKDFLYLGMLTVVPHLQGKGTGKLLLQAAEEKALQWNCKSIVMTVITSRHELISWYKRHGYIETGVKHPFPTEEKFGRPKFPLEFLELKKKI